MSKMNQSVEQGAAPTAGQVSEAGGRRDPVREALRGAGFAEGEALLRPGGDSVQKKDAAAAESRRGDPGGDAVSGPPRAIDPAEIVAEQVAKGVLDENTVTNEVLWRRYPGLRGIKLKAGSAPAAEWLEIRDNSVRPALGAAKKDRQDAPAGGAAATVAKPVAAPKSPKEEGAAPKKGKAAPVDHADLDALLAAKPAAGADKAQKAEWLLSAIGTGLIGAMAITVAQLKQLVNGETKLRTSEGEPDAASLKGGKKGLASKNLQVERVKAGVYDVETHELPILDVMLSLAAGRIRTWSKAGGTERRKLFEFGALIRGDAGFGGSRHTAGKGIDIVGLNFNNDRDVVALLEELDAGKVDMVFPDNKGHVHISLGNSGGYEFGLPFGGGFFGEQDRLGSAQKAAEKAAGTPAEGATITAKGLVPWSSGWYSSTGKFTGGAWKWTKSGEGRARDHLGSGKLKALFSKMERGGGARPSVTVAAEDGVKPEADGK